VVETTVGIKDVLDLYALLYNRRHWTKIIRRNDERRREKGGGERKEGGGGGTGGDERGEWRGEETAVGDEERGRVTKGK